jgi:CBS domain containing-hemolysin-like protein
MDVADTIMKLAGVLLIVALNAFFVAAEFAIVKVRGTQIEPLARAGVARARIAQSILLHLDTYLSACQLGVTMTSLALGWVGEPFVARLIEPLLGLVSVSGSAVVQGVSFAVGFALITYVHIVLGEQAPKWLAIQRAQEATLFVARPLSLFLTVFRPFIWLLNTSTIRVLRLLGFRMKVEGEGAQSEEEIRLLLSRGKSLSSVGRAISLRAIELRDRTAREVMVPRTAIMYLSVRKPIEENIASALEHQFTRYPLCDGSLDQVVGMIHLKDLFKLKGATGSGSALLDIRREMLFVPETTPLEKMLNTFLAKRVLMAMAVDEYGGTAGLVTLENVLEELVGEIRDEFDVETGDVQRISENESLVDGAMSLHDFSRTFGLTIESGEVVTAGGYVVQLLGRMPERGAHVRIGPWLATVDAVAGRRIRTIRLARVATEAATTGTTERGGTHA